MTNPFTNRFKSCHDDLKENGILKSSSSFAKDIGTYRQTLNGIFKGGRNLQLDMLRLAVEKYFFNPYYILTGTGEKFVNPEKEIQEEEDNITMVPIKAQAGYGDHVLDPVFNQSLPTFSIPVPKFKEGEFYSFEVEGDSMYPTLDDGELLICSKLDPVYYTHTIKNDKVFVFVTQEEVLVKRATNKIYPNGIVTLHSDNSENYKPVNLKISKIKEVWKVEGVIKTSLPKVKDDSKTVAKLKEILSSMIEK